MKYLSVFLSFLLIISLVGCNGGENQHGNEESNQCITVWSMGANYEANIEQSNAYRALWNSLEWEENADPSRYNYVFFDSNISIYYDSGTGIFYDMTNKKHATLSEETNAEVRNSIKDLTFVRSNGDVID